MISSDVEVILPLKERTKYLKRCLDYLAGQRVIVVDSSVLSNQPLVDCFENIEYYHRPNFDFFEQCAFGASKVSGNYVYIAADDDFCLREFVEEAKSILEQNGSIAAVTGCFVRFEERNFSLDVLRTERHLKNHNVPRDCIANSFENGYGFFNKGFVAPFHSVLRADILRLILTDFQRFPELKDLKAHDRAFYLLLMRHGKLHLTNFVSHLRSSAASFHTSVEFSYGKSLSDHLNAKPNVLTELFPNSSLYDREKLVMHIARSEPQSRNFIMKQLARSFRGRLSFFIERCLRARRTALYKAAQVRVNRALRAFSNSREVFDLLDSLKKMEKA